MTHTSSFFKSFEKLADGLAQKVYAKSIRLNPFCLFTIILGFLSPFFLWISPWKPLSFIFLLLYVLLDTTINYLEKREQKKNSYTHLIPFPPVVLGFLWFIFIFYEYERSVLGNGLMIPNILSLACITISLLLIYGYLKMNQLPLNIHRFVDSLEDVGEKNERELPLNYLTLTFKIFKKDMIALGIILLGFINSHFLYAALCLGTLFLLFFTIYSLFILKVFGSKKI